MSNHLNYLKVVLLSELLLEANEDLKNSSQYKLGLKQQVSRTNMMLDRIVRSEYDKVYGVDPQMATNVLNKIDSLLNLIKSASIEDLIVIESIVKRYNTDKEKFRESEVVWFDKIN